MKKFYAFAASALAALSMNATLYVVGAGDGLTWDLPGKAYEANADGTYTLQITNLTKFKASTTNTTNWDEYNATAYATGNSSFNNTVYPNGQTLPIQVWGEDQDLPYTGDYTITYDLKAMTMKAVTTTPPPVNAPDVYIRGDMNGWGSSAAWKFTNVSWDASAKTGEYTIKCAIPAGQAFKIADSNWGSINYGGVTSIAANKEVSLTYNSGTNMTLAQAFDGVITFKISKEKSAATVYFAMEGEAKDPEAFYVIGTIAEGAWNPSVGVKMESNGEGLYTAESVTLVESGGSTGFAITAALGATDSDWGTVNALRYGPSVTDTPAVLGVNTDLATGDLTWSFTPGTYKMVFDYKNETLTISSEGGDTPVDPTPNDKTLYIVGANNSWITGDEAYKMEHAEGTNIYTITATNIFGGEWKICDGTWDWNFGMGDSLEEGVDNECWFYGQNFKAISAGEVSLTFTLVEGSDVKDSNIASYVNFTADGGVIVPIPDEWPNWWVNIKGDFNEWSSDFGQQPDEDGIATFTSFAIGTSQFKVCIWNGVADVWHSTGSAVEVKTWVAMPDNNDNNMTIAGAEEGQSYDLKYNVLTDELYVALAGELGVEGVEADSVAAEYFNLQGVRVANPENGLYIVRRGNTVNKVYVK